MNVGPEELFMGYLIGFIIVILAVFGIIWRRGKDIFEPVISIAFLHVLFFVIRPLSLLEGESAFYPLSSYDVITMSFIGGVLGLLGFYIGYFARLPHVIACRLPYAKSTQIVPTSLFLVFYMLLGLISAVLDIKLVGLKTIMYSSIQVARTLNVGDGYLRLGLSMIPIVLYTLYSLKMFNQVSIPNALLWSLLLFSLAAAIFQGTRGELLRISGILFVLWCYSHYKIPKHMIYFI